MREGGSNEETSVTLPAVARDSTGEPQTSTPVPPFISALKPSLIALSLKLWTEGDPERPLLTSSESLLPAAP